jgi:hypothetical protein
MIEKTASVHWEGQGKQGLGAISTATGALLKFRHSRSAADAKDIPAP